MALLIDFGDVPAAHCDDCIEELFKSLASDPHGDAERSMWAPHPNPLLAGHVEEVTRRFQRVLEALQDAFARALTGAPIGTLAKAEPWERWDATQFNAARLHLEAIEPAHYSLDDWLMLVDWLVQRYLPDGVVSDMAQYLTFRAQLAGKVQAEMERRGEHWPAPDLSSLAELIPHEFGELPARALSPVEQAVLRIAKAQAGIHITDVTENARAGMKRLVVEHTQAMLLGHKEGTTERLRQRLFDTFGNLNRDFRRIAITETGECCNTGFVAALKPGQRVRRVEAYRGACDFCRSINGKVFTVVAPDHEPKDGDKEVWIGKTNVGRSASPRKRVGGELVDREPEEMWWVACGTQHPHCRGSWAYVGEVRPGEDAEFGAWLDDLLAKHKRPAAREADAGQAP
ncbi:conserved protein of unknown function (plasmid) [Rhodovastum atsumiense]|uniref:Phage head morphogenesis domain-containing protein n=1 Tax=Rhodovastum atsumiense TaxID=504468 RepID=A0A5M6ITL2_9PROT|nr:hypothetical protein [Rhodovastum atsumiense]KAA5611656.1 hypothetical protein F1189_13935 [Rhodovastum atsumiense]CAH2606244.1 conserved protein of unknown function [Rhodovastum atsumiense]